MFLTSTPGVLEEIRAALAAGNLKETARQLHLFVGSSATVGALSLWEQTRQLEDLLERGDVSALAAGLPDLEQGFESFRAAAETFDPEAVSMDASLV